MGGSATFMHGVSVWVYSSFPPTLVFVIANIIVLFLKSWMILIIVRSQSGLIQANPSFFIDGKAQPVLAALLSGFDLFAIFGLDSGGNRTSKSRENFYPVRLGRLF